MNRIRLIIVFLTLLFFLAACAAGVSRQDILRQIESGSPPMIIDVRTAGEYRSGHVPGAINISLFAFRQRFEELNPPKDAPIVVYCEHGPRGGFAWFVLKISGYKKVFHLDGDMSAWKKNKLPVDN